MYKRLLTSALTFLLVAVLIFGGLSLLSGKSLLEAIEAYWVWLLVGSIIIIVMGTIDGPDRRK